MRCGAEKDLGVIRRHCRNGNKPTVIFQGWNDNRDLILTLNFADGTFCVLPETHETWKVLLSIRAFHECQVCCRNVSWYLTREAMGLTNE